MATVTGKTSAKIDELLSVSVVSGAMDTNGQITLKTRSGSTLSVGSVAGSVTGAFIDPDNNLVLTTRDGSEITVGPGVGGGGGSEPPPTQMVGPLDAWPVGSIFMTTVSTNPATLLGGGTWIRWGQGRVPVSLNEYDSSFDSVEETGGEKNHTLTVYEMPSHNHTAVSSSDGNHTHQYQHTHSLSTSENAQLGGSAIRNNANSTGGATASGSGGPSTQYAGLHTHPITVGYNGSSQPHNVMQPYITCYMWKRTS